MGRVTPCTCIPGRRALKVKLEGSGSCCGRCHQKIFSFAAPVKVRGLGNFPVRALAMV